MNRLLVRLSLACGIAASLAACSQGSVAVVVIAPDGGDPFVGPDAATQARLTLENDGGMSTLVDVAANGSFNIDIRPQSATEISRLHIDAMRGNEVVATGATPLVLWGEHTSDRIPVLMQPRDSLMMGPVTLASARADCQIVDLNADIVAIFTNPASGDTHSLPDGYDLLHHARASNLLQYVSGAFDGDSSMLPVTSPATGTTVLLIARGDNAVLYTGNPMGGDPVQQPMPATRATIVGSTAVVDMNSYPGGWLVGGRNGTTLVTDVLRITTEQQQLTFIPASTLQVARTRPQVITINNPSGQVLWLVGGGNAPDTYALEVYGPQVQSSSRPLELGDNGTNRTDTTIACAATDALGCTRVLVLGGHGSGSDTDLLIDAAQLRNYGPPVIIAHGSWLAHRRAGAQAAFVDGGRVVVAGGSDPTTGAPVTDVEFIDVSAVGTTPAGAVVPGVIVGQSCANPAIHALDNGSVMLAGGTHDDGSPCTDIQFFRH